VSEPAAQLAPWNRTWIAVGLLVALTTLLYGRTLGFEFVNYDDTEYVTDNPLVLQGFSAPGLHWAFTETHTGNWIPLTWLSHMLDVELYGTNAGGHHATNVLLHGANAVLLYLALRALTGRPGPSLAVALFFCCHPQRVESVAWVSERKDLLSGLFFFASLRLHASIARRPGLVKHLALALLFTLGLFSKSMLVTLPFVLCLLDIWPLQRWRGEGPGSERPGTWLRRIREKGLLFLIAFGFAGRTLLAQDAQGAVSALEGLSIPQRLANAGLAGWSYLKQAVWPFDLAVFYPHPVFGAEDLTRELYLPGFLGLALFVAGIALAVVGMRRFAELSVGYLWFLGMLVPVIGLVQVGEQSHADRYTYLPLVGLLIGFVFGLDRILHGRPRYARLASLATAVLVLLLSARTWDQLGHWRDSRALFAHALEVTDKNYIAHNNYGLALLGERRLREAGEHFEKAVAIYPNYLKANYNLGITLEGRGRYDEAIEAYRRCLQVDPGHRLSLTRVVECQRKRDDRELRRGSRKGERSNPAKEDPSEKDGTR